MEYTPFEDLEDGEILWVRGVKRGENVAFEDQEWVFVANIDLHKLKISFDL